jgi:hypothetical protein
MLVFIDKEIGSPSATLDLFLIGEHEPKLSMTNYQRELVLRHRLRLQKTYRKGTGEQIETPELLLLTEMLT